MTPSLRGAFAHSPAFGLKVLARKLAFALAVFVIVSPAILVFVWMLSLSLKNEIDNTTYPPILIPTEWAWRNYAAVFEQNPFLLYTWNSIIVS
jgi:multiple sugar transport system permease protein